MSALRNQRGLGIFDTLIVLILISILIVVLLPKYERMAREAREVALQMGLGNIRKAIQVYQVFKQKPPADLRDLIIEPYILPIEPGSIFIDRYLKLAALDGDGYPVDPFGHRFGYDPQVGRVFSTTAGYERW